MSGDGTLAAPSGRPRDVIAYGVSTSTMDLARSIDNPFLTTDGTESTRSFASRRPKPVTWRTALIAAILLSPTDVTTTEYVDAVSSQPDAAIAVDRRTLTSKFLAMVCLSRGAAASLPFEKSRYERRLLKRSSWHTCAEKIATIQATRTGRQTFRTEEAPL